MAQDEGGRKPTNQEIDEDTNPGLSQGPNLSQGESTENSIDVQTDHDIDNTSIIATDDELDRTSVINDQGIKREFEKTKLHGDIHLDDSIENTAKTKLDSTDKSVKTPKKKFQFFNNLKRKFQNKSESKKDSVSITYYLNYFFWSLLSIGIFSALFFSSYLLFEVQWKIAFIIGSSSLMMLLLGVLGLVKKWPPFTLFSLSSFCLFSLLSVYLLKYGFNLSVELGALVYIWDQLFIYLFLGIIFVELIFIIFHAPHSKILKILLLLPVLYGLSGFVYYYVQGYSINVGWFDIKLYLPWKIPENLNFFLSPLWIFMQPYLYLAFLSALLGVVFGKSNVVLRKLYFLKLLWLIPILIVSSLVLQSIRVPNPIFWIKGYPNMISKVQVNEQNREFELATLHEKNIIPNDQLVRFNLSILDYEFQDGGDSVYYLSASTIDGYPVYNLSKKDLNLFINRQKISVWNLKTLSFEEPKLKALNFNEAAFYRVSLSTQKPYPSFSFHNADEGRIFSQDESIHFSLDQNSPSVQEVFIFIDGEESQSFKTKDYQRFFSFNFEKISAGDHKLKVLMIGHEDLEVSKEIEVKVVEKETAKVLVPSPNEVFRDKLAVFIQIPDYYPVYQTKVLLKINGDQKDVLNRPPYQTILDTSALMDGAYNFEVEVLRQKGSFDSEWEIVDRLSMPIQKGDRPEVSFEIPTIGEFLNIESLFKIRVSDDSFDRVELHHREEVVFDWKSKPYMANINTFSADDLDQLYIAKAYNVNGSVASTWNEVSVGRGRFQLSLSDRIDQSLNPFLKKVVFILDSSMSMNDIWDEKSKWFWSTVIFSIPDLTHLFDQMEMGVMALGTKYSSQFNKCEDRRWFSSDLKFSSHEILSKSYQHPPKGIFGLYDNLDEALQVRPDKIIIISDGSDACHHDLPKKLLAKLKLRKTEVNYIGLGPLGDKDKKNISKLNQLENISFQEVLSGDELVKYLSDLLAVNYELHLNGKLYYKAPIDNQEKLIRSGEYDLYIPSFPNLDPVKVRVFNGITSRFKIESQGKKLKIKRSL